MNINDFKIKIELTELDKLLLSSFELQVINDYNEGTLINGEVVVELFYSFKIVHNTNEYLQIIMKGYSYNIDLYNNLITVGSKSKLKGFTYVEYPLSLSFKEIISGSYSESLKKFFDYQKENFA